MLLLSKHILSLQLYKAGYHKNPGLEALIRLPYETWNPVFLLLLSSWQKQTSISSDTCSKHLHILSVEHGHYHPINPLTSNTQQEFRRAHKSHSQRTRRILKLQRKLMVGIPQQNPVGRGEGHEAFCSQVPPRHLSYQDHFWCKPSPCGGQYK